jgi:hypothetical protein
MTEKRNWPTREEWARNRTTLYADQAPGLDHTLKAHASEAEIREAISALENLWRDLGRQMRNPASKQPRSHFLEDTDYRECQFRRKAINRMLKEMRDGWLPVQGNVDEALREMFAPFYVRQWKKRDADLEKAQREKAATPVDDAAWEKELEWRRKSEDDAAHPERFIHRV